MISTELSPVSMLPTALVRLVRDLTPEGAVSVLFAALLGRPPDSEGLSYYSVRFSGSELDKISVVEELCASEEASRFGLFALSEMAIPRSDAEREEASLALLFAGLGLACRRVVEMSDRIDRFDELARLTLLTVPEICGDAFDGIRKRLDSTERELRAVRKKLDEHI